MKRGGRAPLRRQAGMALIAVAAVLVAGTAWLSVSLLGDAQTQSTRRRAKDAATLQEAKAALIAFAAQRAYEPAENSPGRLPCPEDPAYMTDADGDNDGLEAATCTLPAVGRLPWRTLGLAPLRDTSGELLWYAVSPGWAIATGASPAAVAINSNTPGQITLDGQVPATATPSNTVAALVISPGPPLTLAPTAAQQAAGCAARVQTRGALPPDLRNYLECDNATFPANASFASTVTGNAANTVLNDLMLAISPAEILDRVEPVIAARIERDVVPHLKAYAQDSIDGWANAQNPAIFPFAAPFASTASSNWQGASATYQGLLPLTRSQNCNPATEADCSTGFVQWDLAAGASFNWAAASGTSATRTASCASSTSTVISCAVTYGGRAGRTSSGTLNSLQITVTAKNVGMGFKTRPTTAGITAATISPSAGTTSTKPARTALTMTASGSVTSTYTVSLPSVACGGNACTTTSTVTIALPTYPDHYVLNPGSPVPGPASLWWWFKNSAWRDALYYAVAPKHTATGVAQPCTTGVDCLSITNVSPAGGQRAILILTGRTLAGAARPSASLSDYVDAVAVSGVSASVNQDGDTTFYKASATAGLNDRFIVLDSN